VYVGITDVAAPEPIPDVPLPDPAEVCGLIADVGTALRAPVPPEAVLGAFAGLRPLLAAPDGRTADLSRRHAVVVDPSGLVSVVGGKLTTYRAMAQDAVDRAVQVSGLQAGPCRTRRLPLVGAADRAALAAVRAPARLVARYGTEAERLLTEAGPDPRWHEPIAPGVATTRAELAFAVAHEGAQSEEDLLDRRTRVGLVATDRELALPAAREVLAQARDA
jgi:glycerol-3-phosphate dehydrogenase